MEPLARTHLRRIADGLSARTSVICELALPSLFAWRRGRRMCVIEVEEALVLAVPCGTDGIAIFGPPIGNITLEQAIDATQKKTGERVVACERIPESVVQTLTSDAGLVTFEDRNNFDYVYRRSDLADLGGRKYHKKRNLIAQCLKEYDCTYESYSPLHIPALRDMHARWCREHRCAEMPGLCQEYLAINELLNCARDFELFGGTIKIGGTIEAYALASRLNDTTVAVHFEKALPAFKGLYQLINHWVCQHEFGSFEFVNREQDTGVEGLRKAKESYFPDHMIKKYVVLNGITLEEFEAKKIQESRCVD